MALVRNLIFKKSLPYENVRNEIKKLDLKGCKRIIIKYDPFRTDTKEIRHFNYFILSYPANISNKNLLVKTEIVADRSEPLVNIDLVSGEKLLLKCANLNVLDIFKLLNDYVTPLAPKDVDTSENREKLEKKKKKK